MVMRGVTDCGLKRHRLSVHMRSPYPRLPVLALGVIVAVVVVVNLTSKSSSNIYSVQDRLQSVLEWKNTSGIPIIQMKTQSSGTINKKHVKSAYVRTTYQVCTRCGHYTSWDRGKR